MEYVKLKDVCKANSMFHAVGCLAEHSEKSPRVKIFNAWPVSDHMKMNVGFGEGNFGSTL